MSSEGAEACPSDKPQDMGKQTIQTKETQKSGSVDKEMPTSASPAVPSSPKLCKVDVLLKPAGNAPILKKKKWTVDRHKKISWIAEFIRKCIRTETEDSVFVYVNQSFSPAPDTDIGTLFDCFGSDGKLVIYYCRTQAWG